MRVTSLAGGSLLLIFLHYGSGLNVRRQLREDTGELVFTSVLYRHGERTPERPYTNDPYKNLSYWPTGWGMLTNNGKRQHYHLGKWLRKRYTSLIPEGKYSHDLIYIQSTDWDRTLMSALSNLAGLFYPNQQEIWSDLQWQPIPVHTIPMELDKVLYMGHPCPKYNEELDVITNSSMYRHYNEQHRELYNYLTENTGEPTDDPIKVQELTSTLHIETLNNFTLPDWTKRVYPDELYRVGVMAFRMQTMTKKMKRLYGGPLLKEIITHMKEKRSRTLNPDRNLWVYSAHDTTVASLLDTMGVFETHMPPFAATVLVELRKNSNDQYHVSVHYKNTTEEPILLTIPGCSPYCPLDTFEGLLADVIPGDWDEECRSTRKIQENNSITYEEAMFEKISDVLDQSMQEYSRNSEEITKLRIKHSNGSRKNFSLSSERKGPL